MPRTIDLIRASKLPSNMMQFAAKGALSVPPDEILEILVYLAKHNQVFGSTARLTLAAWDEKASLAAAGDPKTAREVLDYLVSPDNLRPKLLPALLENPAVAASELAKFAVSANQDGIAAMLQSARVRGSKGILESLRSNPYLKGEQATAVAGLLNPGGVAAQVSPVLPPVTAGAATQISAKQSEAITTPVVEPVAEAAATGSSAEEGGEVPDETVSAYLAEHAQEIAAEKDKPFQPVGGIVDLLGADYFPVSENKSMTEIVEVEEVTAEPAAAASRSAG